MELIKFITIHHSSRNSPSWTFMNYSWTELRLIKFIIIHQSSWNDLMNFHEPSYELNRSYQVHKNSWLFMKLSIWASWTNSWTTLVHQVLINIHDLSWTVLMNSMNWLDEPLMNVHKCSWTFINVHHLMNFISPGLGSPIWSKYQLSVHSSSACSSLSLSSAICSGCPNFSCCLRKDQNSRSCHIQTFFALQWFTGYITWY